MAQERHHCMQKPVVLNPLCFVHFSIFPLFLPLHSIPALCSPPFPPPIYCTQLRSRPIPSHSPYWLFLLRLSSSPSTPCSLPPLLFPLPLPFFCLFLFSLLSAPFSRFPSLLSFFFSFLSSSLFSAPGTSLSFFFLLLPLPPPSLSLSFFSRSPFSRLPSLCSILFQRAGRWHRIQKIAKQNRQSPST